MSEVWDYQIRATLSDRAAELVREKQEVAELAPLIAVAERHNAKIASQYDAFAQYVAEAEKNGEQDYPRSRHSTHLVILAGCKPAPRGL